MLINHRNIPSLDLHGEISSMVLSLVTIFIDDNLILSNAIIKVVHGTSSNILKDELYRVLENNKKVLNYHINNENMGETIIYLK